MARRDRTGGEAARAGQHGGLGLSWPAGSAHPGALARCHPHRRTQLVGGVPVLSRHFRVLAFDQRGHGHGRGLGGVGGYRLEQCADDVAELAAILDVDRFIGSAIRWAG